MKALVLEEAGPRPLLVQRDVPNPGDTLARDEVLVAVQACGFCRHDLLVMQGVLRRGVRLPLVLGHEIAGRVADMGPDVTGLTVGDAVVSLPNDVCGRCQRCLQGQHHRCLDRRALGHGVPGGLAEYVKVRRASVIPVPKSIPWEQACLLACPVGVALRAVREAASLQPSQTAVVTGAGGGLGASLVQAAKLHGARVLAVTSSPDKQDALQSLGADHVIVTGELDFSQVVLALTEDAGADVVLDTVGAALFPQSLRSLSQFGRWVVLGETTGESVSLNLAELLFRNATVTGVTGTNRVMVEESVRLAESGALRPVVHRQMPWDQIAEAARMLQHREVLGRIVLRPPTPQ